MLAALVPGAGLTFAIDVAKTKLVAAFAIGSDVLATVTWQPDADFNVGAIARCTLIWHQQLP